MAWDDLTDFFVVSTPPSVRCWVTAVLKPFATMKSMSAERHLQCFSLSSALLGKFKWADNSANFHPTQRRRMTPTQYQSISPNTLTPSSSSRWPHNNKHLSPKTGSVERDEEPHSKPGKRPGARAKAKARRRQRRKAPKSQRSPARRARGYAWDWHLSQGPMRPPMLASPSSSLADLGPPGGIPDDPGDGHHLSPVSHRLIGRPCSVKLRASFERCLRIWSAKCRVALGPTGGVPERPRRWSQT